MKIKLIFYIVPLDVLAVSIWVNVQCSLAVSKIWHFCGSSSWPEVHSAENVTLWCSRVFGVQAGYTLSDKILLRQNFLKGILQTLSFIVLNIATWSNNMVALRSVFESQSTKACGKVWTFYSTLIKGNMACLYACYVLDWCVQKTVRQREKRGRQSERDQSSFLLKSCEFTSEGTFC